MSFRWVSARDSFELKTKFNGVPLPILRGLNHCYDTEKFYPVMYALLQAEARGELSEGLLKQSACRIKQVFKNMKRARNIR